ncbi:hypothetical protein [Rhodopseudomonas sp. RCAM05734]|uniref:hypothetical protein n=1 Tax=Rhodopseudomonas sp. RCAM05734 TaxID=3457549 RepID=UPI004043A39B
MGTAHVGRLCGTRIAAVADKTRAQRTGATITLCHRKRSAALADTLDHSIELAILGVDLAGVVAAGLGRNVARARLAMADRSCCRRGRLLRLLRALDRGRRRIARRDLAPARSNFPASSDKRLSRAISSFCFSDFSIASHRVRSGTSIVAQFRRPCAEQSCTFRTSAMVPSSQIPAATSTTKNPSITAFSNPRLPSSSGGSRFTSVMGTGHGFGG